jgi:hypothetical protein
MHDILDNKISYLALYVFGERFSDECMLKTVPVDIDDDDDETMKMKKRNFGSEKNISSNTKQSKNKK